MRLQSILSKGAIMALAVLVISLLVVTNFEAEQDIQSASHRSEITIEEASGTGDTMSVMQGPLSLVQGEGELQEAAESGDTVSVLQGKVNVHPIGQKALSDKVKGVQKVAEESKTSAKGTKATAMSHAALSLGESIRQKLTTATTFIRSRTSGPTMIVLVVMIVLVLVCAGIALVGMLNPKKRGSGTAGDFEDPQTRLSNDRLLSPQLSTRPTPQGTGNMLSQGPTPLGVSPAPSGSMMMAGLHTGSHPVLSQSRIEHTFEAEAGSQPPGSQQFLMAPPLCSTLVMPVSEARFGVPMFELAEVKGEGEVSIVGLSGNPLLRGVVRRIGKARTLEISMPEQQSAPRATITPSMQELAGGASAGCRVLEIRGKRGAFYGTLEMRSSGACYVLREGQTILTIDGEAESLQLSIKSSVGLQLASVRCSAEPFGGVDHVEIRVEPGVDSVLVVAVVLAVLLLSDANED